MALIRPFQALRPTPEAASRVFQELRRAESMIQAPKPSLYFGQLRDGVHEQTRFAVC